jgi:hypothetical protein
VGAAPTQASITQAGPYAYQAYTAGIAAPVKGAAYAKPGVYYPVNGPANAPGMIYIPGLDGDWSEAPFVANGKVESYHYSWGEFLASWGFIVMYVNPSDLSVGPEDRETSLLQKPRKPLSLRAKELEVLSTESST